MAIWASFPRLNRSGAEAFIKALRQYNGQGQYYLETVLEDNATALKDPANLMKPEGLKYLLVLSVTDYDDYLDGPGELVNLVKKLRFTITQIQQGNGNDTQSSTRDDEKKIDFGRRSVARFTSKESKIFAGPVKELGKLVGQFVGGAERGRKKDDETFLQIISWVTMQSTEVQELLGVSIKGGESLKEILKDAGEQQETELGLCNDEIQRRLKAVISDYINAMK